MQEQLQNVQHIQANHCAVAAILESGAVVTWGDSDFGADSSQVQELSLNLLQSPEVRGMPFEIISTKKTFTCVTRGQFKEQKSGCPFWDQLFDHLVACCLLVVRE